jgi:hypothetical protein
MRRYAISGVRRVKRPGDALGLRGAPGIAGVEPDDVGVGGEWAVGPMEAPTREAVRMERSRARAVSSTIWV